MNFCTCYVRTLSFVSQCASTRGQHAVTCPTFVEATDPVERWVDTVNRENRGRGVYWTGVQGTFPKPHTMPIAAH